MPEDIVFDDLAQPQLGHLQRLLLRAAASTKVELSEAAVLNAARAATGCSEFGPDDFRERLQLLLNDYNADQELTAVGRSAVFNDLVRCASNRLLIHQRRSTVQDLDEVQLQPPLAVAGLPRSGTTHLVNLLAADTRFQSLPLWRMQEPFIAQGKGKPSMGLRFKAMMMRRLLASEDTSHPDPRYLRCSLRWSGMQMMTPKLAAMHPMNPDHIHEELELMTFDFASNQFEWTSLVPGYRDHYLASDQTPHYAYMRDVLKLMALEEGSHRPYVLKCVQNPEQLPALKSVLPNATVILTHRDPVAVIQSTATMIAYGQRMQRTHVDPPAVFEYWADRFEKLLRACVRDRHVWGVDRSLDIMFHELMEDEQNAVERIYAHYGLELTDTARDQMRAFSQAHPRGKYGRVRYRLQEHFGVKADDVRKRFDFYFNAFPVRPEV